MGGRGGNEREREREREREGEGERGEGGRELCNILLLTASLVLV